MCSVVLRKLGFAAGAALIAASLISLTVDHATARIAKPWYAQKGDAYDANGAPLHPASPLISPYIGAMAKPSLVQIRELGGPVHWATQDEHGGAASDD